MMAQTTKAQRSRRAVGGNEWNVALDGIKGDAQRLASELVELGKSARSVETANRITAMVAVASQISVTALELQDYKP